MWNTYCRQSLILRRRFPRKLVEGRTTNIMSMVAHSGRKPRCFSGRMPPGTQQAPPSWANSSRSGIFVVVYEIYYKLQIENLVGAPIIFCCTKCITVALYLLLRIFYLYIYPYSYRYLYRSLSIYIPLISLGAYKFVLLLAYLLAPDAKTDENKHFSLFLGCYKLMNDRTRLFCDLHGNELLYHKPRGEVKGETAGYDATPAGKVDMFKVTSISRSSMGLSFFTKPWTVSHKLKAS